MGDPNLFPQSFRPFYALKVKGVSFVESIRKSEDFPCSFYRLFIERLR
jgi:hypothetical protein